MFSEGAAEQEIPLNEEHWEGGVLGGKSTGREEHWEGGALGGRSTEREEH